nr:MAG TPA: hypothetical protein [Caudoviricetes sp.]
MRENLTTDKKIYRFLTGKRKHHLPPKENRGGRASTPRNWPPR